VGTKDDRAWPDAIAHRATWWGHHRAEQGDYILEDGLFFESYKTLIDDEGFSLKWVDRHALPRLHEPVIVSSSALDRNAAPHALAQIQPTIDSMKPQPQPAPATMEVEESPLTAHMPRSFWVEPARRSKSTRMKYTCPGCQAKVYGRPGLALRCDDCNEAFQAFQP